MNTQEFEDKKLVLMEQLADVSRDIWHNASLLNVQCDVAEGVEDQFDSFLREETDLLFERLRDLAHSYGFYFKFSQYGRSGATIAPVEITIEEQGRFVGIDTRGVEPPVRAYNPDGSRDEEEEELIKHARLLEFLGAMNSFIDTEKHKLPARWREFESIPSTEVDPRSYPTLIIDQEGGVIQGVYLSGDKPLNVVLWDREIGPAILLPNPIRAFPEEDLMLVDQALIAYYESQEEK